MGMEAEIAVEQAEMHRAETLTFPHTLSNASILPTGLGDYLADPDSPADEHGQRVPVKELYEYFSNWYRDWVDDKMRFLPSKRAFTTEICRRGARGMKRGGVRYVYGLQMAAAGEVRP